MLHGNIEKINSINAKKQEPSQPVIHIEDCDVIKPDSYKNEFVT